MRSEAEIRVQLDYLINEQEGGIDPFTDPDMAPQEWICTYCVLIRLLKWVLSELEVPYVVGGMMQCGRFGSKQPADYSPRLGLYGDPPDYKLGRPKE